MKRLSTLWKGLWESIASKGEENYQLLVEGTIRDYRDRQLKIRQNLTNLVFQKKRLEQKMNESGQELKELTMNMEKSVQAGKDELALKIISKIENTKEEVSFLKQQVDKLEVDIAEASRIEKELGVKIGESGEKLRLLGSRIEALKLRKELQEDLNALGGSIRSLSTDNGIQRLKDQALKLEVELENVGGSDLDIELRKLEQENINARHIEMLDKVKAKLKIAKPVDSEDIVVA
jgi:phage shock protein A